jgi:hypothetical protein
LIFIVAVITAFTLLAQTVAAAWLLLGIVRRYVAARAIMLARCIACAQRGITGFYAAVKGHSDIALWYVLGGAAAAQSKQIYELYQLHFTRPPRSSTHSFIALREQLCQPLPSMTL